MDIQSAALNELFVLYPVHVSGLRPVKPVGIADGGIPQALYNDKQSLVCVVDPWTELQLRAWTMAVNDRVDLYVNDHPNPATGKTVAKGEEKERIPLSLPYGWLDHGVNVVYYQVSRAGGNVEKSRDLRVLYHSSTPESLDLIIPPDVIKDGVGPEQAAQGVEFGFTYTNRRNHDRIEFLLGDTKISFDVPDAPTPITQKLFTVEFQKAGDNPSAVAEFRVYDQLGNLSQSSRKRLGIHLNRLMVPTLTKVMDASNTEIPQAGTTTSTTLNLAGKASNAQTVEIFDGSGPSAVSKGTAVADATTGDWTHTITVAPGAHRLYAQSRYHSTPVYSNVRNLTVVAALKLSFTNAPYTVASGGRLKAINLLLHSAADTPMPNATITLTLPDGFTYSDGGNGARDFTSGAEGVVIVSGVKGAATPGPYTLRAASSGASEATAELTVMERGPVGTIVGLASPYHVAISPDGARAYVTNRANSSVSVIDTVNNSVIQTIKVGQDPWGVAVHPDGSPAYVTHNKDTSVWVIDTATNSVIQTIPVEHSSSEVAVHPDGSRAYITAMNDSSVSVIDTVNIRVIQKIQTRGASYRVAVHPDGSRAYVTNYTDSSVSVIDTATNKVTERIAVERGPLGVAVHPDDSRAYVTNFNDNSVSVIDTATNKVTERIAVKQGPYGIAVHPDGSRVYVTNRIDSTVSTDTWVSVIDTATNSMIQTIPIGRNSYGVAVHPDGRVYVTNSDDNSVSVFVSN
jgi:YVTN family beta-propeller protein